MTQNPWDIEVDELDLFIQNDGNLFRRRKEPAIKLLKKKMNKNIYDETKALKLIRRNIVDEGAKEYEKLFALKGDARKMFPKNVRDRVSQEQLKDIIRQINEDGI